MKKTLSLILFLFSLTAFSQVTTSTVNGKIKSKGGELVPHSSIQIVYTPTSTKYGASADEKGLFHIYNANVGGPYTIKITSVGFKPYEKSNLEFNLGDNILDVSLDT